MAISTVTAHGRGRSDVMDGTVDLVVADLTATWLRQQVVDFTYRFYEEPTSMLTLSTSRNSLYIVEPLHVHVWLTYISAGVAVALIMYSVAAVRANVLAKHDKEHAGSFVWRVLSAVLYQDASLASERGPSKMILESFWLCVVVIMVTYTAGLAALLSVTKTTLPFSTLEEVVQDPEYYLSVNEFSAARNLFQEAQGGVYARAWERSSMRTQGSLQAVWDMFHYDQKVVIVNDLTANTMQAHNTGYCNWGILDEKILPSGFAMPMPAGSPYKVYFDYELMRIHEAGLFVHWKKKYFGFLDKNECAPSVDATSEKLSLADLWPIFALAITCTAICFSVLISEIIYWRSGIKIK